MLTKTASVIYFIFLCFKAPFITSFSTTRINYNKCFNNTLTNSGKCKKQCQKMSWGKARAEREGQTLCLRLTGQPCLALPLLSIAKECCPPSRRPQRVNQSWPVGSQEIFAGRVLWCSPLIKKDNGERLFFLVRCSVYNARILRYHIGDGLRNNGQNGEGWCAKGEAEDAGFGFHLQFGVKFVLSIY